MTTFREQLDALLCGPYRGRGGNGALAADLGIHKQTLKLWKADRVEPSFANRQAVADLWAEKCGEGA